MPGAYRVQKVALDTLELEIRIVVSSHVVLGTDSGSSAGTSALNLFKPSLQPQTIVS